MADGRRSTWTLAAFAGPCIPLAAFGLPLVITLPHFYASTLGLSLGAVGLAFILVRLVDIMFDPVFGTILDRTRWSFGRFKGWMAISAPILMLSIWMLFMAKPGVGIGYLWFWLLVVYFGYSIAVLSHTAWAATLSKQYHERSRIYAFWQGGNVLGMISILGLPLILAVLSLINARNETEVVSAQGWFVVLLLPITIGLAIWRVPETAPMEVIHAERATLGDYVRLIRRPTVIRILVADLLTGLAPGVAGTLYFWFFMVVKKFSGQESLALLMIYFLSAIVGGFIWTRLAKRTGKAKALIIACIVYAAVQFGVVTLPAGNFLLAIPFLIAAGIPYSAGALLLRSMMADYGDEERLASGRDRTGLLYAILTGTVKVGSALAVTSTIILAGLGFNAANPALSTDLSMQGLMAMYAVVPGVIGLLAAACLIGYPLSEERHAEILRQLEERDGTHPPPQPEDVAAIAPDVLPTPAE
jgi:GPH family glycoside/pentoside/hexuronide:cation symporter